MAKMMPEKGAPNQALKRDQEKLSCLLLVQE
ncbi:MAG: hypothetical protein RLZZ227_958 [Pseudomonadota bacterium]